MAVLSQATLLQQSAVIMSDDGWDLISRDPESDLCSLEKEDEDTVGDSIASTTSAGKKRNEFQNEGCGSGSDYGALFMSESESDKETESEEESESDKGSDFEGEKTAQELGQVREDHETAFISAHENDSEDTSGEEAEEDDKEIYDECHDTDTLVDSTPGLQSRDNTSSHTSTAAHPSTQTSAIERLDDELEKSIHHWENIIKPLVDEISRSALNENPFKYLRRFARYHAIQQSLPLALQKKISQLSSIIQELPGSVSASSQEYRPTAPRDGTRKDEFGKIVEDDGLEMKLRQYRSCALARERIRQGMKGTYSCRKRTCPGYGTKKCVYEVHYAAEESDHFKCVTVSQALRDGSPKLASQSGHSQGNLQGDPGHRRPHQYARLHGQDDEQDAEIEGCKPREACRRDHVDYRFHSGVHIDRWGEVKEMLAQEYMSPFYEIQNQQIQL